MWETEKQNKKKTKWKRPKNPIKIVFLNGGHPKTRKMKKKWIFDKNCLTRFESGREKNNAHFRAHYLFWPKKLFLDQNSETRKNYKNSGFSGNCPKPKMTFFLKKVSFLTWVKIGFYCVFEKLCSSENTIL